GFISVPLILPASGRTLPVACHRMLAAGHERMPQYGALHHEVKMTRRTNALVRWIGTCWLVSLAAVTVAQSQPAAKGAASPLAPVAWLVGGTWTSEVKSPQDGSVTHVESHIKWAPNHQAIQFVTDFNGKAHYNGFYAYDPVKKTINFYYTSEEGQL